MNTSVPQQPQPPGILRSVLSSLTSNKVINPLVSMTSRLFARQGQVEPLPMPTQAPILPSISKKKSRIRPDEGGGIGGQFNYGDIVSNAKNERSYGGFGENNRRIHAEVLSEMKRKEEQQKALEEEKKAKAKEMRGNPLAFLKPKNK